MKGALGNRWPSGELLNAHQSTIIATTCSNECTGHGNFLRAFLNSRMAPGSHFHALQVRTRPTCIETFVCHGKIYKTSIYMYNTNNFMHMYKQHCEEISDFSDKKASCDVFMHIGKW